MSVLNSQVREVDFINAVPTSLPIASEFTEERVQQDLLEALGAGPSRTLKLRESSLGAEGTGQETPEEMSFSAGNEGSGRQTPTMLGAPGPSSQGDPPNASAEFGTSGLPFSTARADLNPSPTNDQYPYRASGKLFFIGADGKSYVCSASLVKRGVVLTAAHCVAPFGKKSYNSGFAFVPGYRNGVAPYGRWSVVQARVLDSWYQGTDVCSQAGVVCRNDVAVLVLSPKKDANNKVYYAGTNAGWYGFGWDKEAGFTSQNITHITQIGYPGCLDNGGLMQRNDAQGVISKRQTPSGETVELTIIGSLMCGGSSGGGWFINFGIRPTLTGTAAGTASTTNLLVGVTSFGSTEDAVKRMGASAFVSDNAPVLVKAACDAHPDACEE